jgi:hypothetical protein
VIGFVAAVLFAIAFVGCDVHVHHHRLAPASLLLAGLPCIALHIAGIGSGWSVRRQWRRDQPLTDRSRRQR